MRNAARLIGLTALLLMAACQSAGSSPLTLIDADLMIGAEQSSAVAGSSEDRWATWVFRVRLRNDGGGPLRNIETRLLTSDAISGLYEGEDPFAAAGGKRSNYGQLSSGLNAGGELEVKRSIAVAPISLDSDGNDETLTPDAIARLLAVREAADGAVFEITFDGGSQRFELSGLLEQKDWPPFTMVYELEQGQAVMVGDRHVESRQVRRLEYRSATEWTDTVLESADIETRVGTFSQTGSYRRLDGLRLVEYDAATDSTSEDAVSEGARHLPGAGFLPFRNRVLEEVNGIIPTMIETGVLVCFRDECEDNAIGQLFILESGRERVYADDSRGFPLRFGTSFVVKELRVDDEQK